MPAPFTTPVCWSVPFEANRSPWWGGAGFSGITSLNAQEAIEEVKAFAESTSRFAVATGFDGNASPTRWLEFITNIASNVTPFALPRIATLRELSFTTNGNSTCTARVYKNGVSLQTIATAGTAKAAVTGLSFSFAALDTVSVAITAGSAARPMVFLFFVFT